MRKDILFVGFLTVVLLALVWCCVARAEFIPPPPPLQKMPVELQQYLRKVSDNFNNLNVDTVAPNGNRLGRSGDAVIYNNTGMYELWVNTTGTPTTPTTVWQKI